MKSKQVMLTNVIAGKIFLVRGCRVMLDSDLASLYGVSTKRLNEQVKRNLKRFPEDFMFRLSKTEVESLRSQFATSKIGRGGRRYAPLVFTEQGVAMLSSVLGSERAVQVNIAIMRAFVKLREIMSTHKELANQLTRLENKVHKHDKEIRAIFKAIRLLMTPAPPPEKPRHLIGFHPS